MLQRKLKTYRVHIRSSKETGFQKQFAGRIKVLAFDANEAAEKAIENLRIESFPERDRSMWDIEEIEILSKD